VIKRGHKAHGYVPVMNTAVDPGYILPPAGLSVLVDQDQDHGNNVSGGDDEGLSNGRRNCGISGTDFGRISQCAGCGCPVIRGGIHQADQVGKWRQWRLPSAATPEQLSLMLQNLLADRFKLKFHRETREVPGYALVVAKNGPKLKENKNANLNTIMAQKTSMSQLANTLTNLPDNVPVVDKTGLLGFYDFTLTWEPGESVSAVLQEQLGLKLESQKVPVDFYVIDSAEKPSEN
jgi:hypothetical protein